MAWRMAYICDVVPPPLTRTRISTCPCSKVHSKEECKRRTVERICLPNRYPTLASHWHPDIVSRHRCFEYINFTAFFPTTMTPWQFIPLIQWLTCENLSVPINNTGSNVFNFKISGCNKLIGTPLTLINPVPFLTKATAVAVFFRPKHWTDSIDILYELRWTVQIPLWVASSLNTVVIKTFSWPRDHAIVLVAPSGFLQHRALQNLTTQKRTHHKLYD